MITFIIGSMFGAIVGYGVCAMLVVGKRGDV
jgi:hypothetical protein